MKENKIKEVTEVITESVSEKKRYVTKIMEMMLKILQQMRISYVANGNDLGTRTEIK